MKYNEYADTYLEELYASVGAITTENKVQLLSLILGDEINISATGVEITDEVKLGVLEYEILESAGMIHLTTG